MEILFADGFGVVGMLRIVGILLLEFRLLRHGQIILEFLNDGTLGRELSVVFVHVSSFGHFALTDGDLVGQEVALGPGDGQLLVGGLRKCLILFHRSRRDFQRALQTSNRRPLHVELTEIGVGYRLVDNVAF